MKRIGIVTATRAEYGLLLPLISAVEKDEELSLDLIVTGTHLSRNHGYTLDQIISDGYPIAHKIPILEDDNSSYGVSCTMANALKGFAKCFSDDRPDIVIILGDRTEMLAVASAAMNECVPIAHIHGGEVTEGAVDDCVRHAITKMSYLHFAGTEIYRKRIIQLGENPGRVFNVGTLGAENILSDELYDEEYVLDYLNGLKEIGDRPYAIVTFHPVTLEKDEVKDQVKALCEAIKERKDIFFIITSSNADVGGQITNSMLQEYAEKNTNAAFTINLGTKRYLSTVKYASFVLGNSSSGILEAPILGTPTVNIGDRQRGRLMADSIVSCKTVKSDIADAIRIAESMPHNPSKMYGDGHTSERIVNTIKKYLTTGIDLKKGFYDVDM